MEEAICGKWDASLNYQITANTIIDSFPKVQLN